MAMMENGYTVRTVNVTRPGMGQMASGAQAYGEDGAVATRYQTTLVERRNMSTNRNNDLEGTSGGVGSVPMVTQMSRKTGRIA